MVEARGLQLGTMTSDTQIQHDSSRGVDSRSVLTNSWRDKYTSFSCSSNITTKQQKVIKNKF